MRERLLERLLQVYFETHGIELILGSIDWCVANVPEFPEEVYALSRMVWQGHSAGDIDNMVEEFSVEIQRDLDSIAAQSKVKVSKYGVYLYQIPETGFPNIVRYAKAWI
jgi:hypothetical protein